MEAVVIDWSRVQELRREIGEEGFAEVVELFLDEVETVIGRLAAATTANASAEDMHFLKGSAWNLGFVEFGALCHDGERRAVAGRFDKADLERVMACYATSKAAFLAGVADRSAPTAA